MIPQQSFFLAFFSLTLSYLILLSQFVDGSTSWILLQSWMAAEQSYLSVCTQALRTRDFVYLGSSSSDLFRSSSALKLSFCFMYVRALLENRIEFSFLFDGSRSKASEQTQAAYLYAAAFKSSFPFSFNCSPLEAFFKTFLSFQLSGSYFNPSWKCLLAFPLSPEQSSINPFKQLTSVLDPPDPSSILSTFLASSVSPVLASSQHFTSSKSGLLWTFPRMQLTDSKASEKLFSLILSNICLQFF